MTAALLQRLEAVAAAIAATGDGLALLALGSAADTARMDRWSDLDFFAVVRPGTKAAFIDDLGWLAAPCPLAWTHRNTADGWKALYTDGIFAEFAVFEPAELATIPFAPGRIVWSAAGFDAALCVPAARHAPQRPDPTWLRDEALSNLLIGIGRWRRGERLAGFRMVQVHALDNILRMLEAEAPDPHADPFAPDRRFEARRPDLAPRIADWAPGVDGTPDAALALLAFLESRGPIPPAMAAAIRRAAA